MRHDLPSRRVLAKLPVGQYEAAVVFRRDPYVGSRCRSAPVAFAVEATPPPRGHVSRHLP